MTDIEIPQPNERGARYRFFEMLPGLLSWTILFLPVILSFISVRLAAVFVLGYLLFYFARTMSTNIRVMQGYRKVQQYQKMPWSTFVGELEQLEVPKHARRPKWHAPNVARVATQGLIIKPSEVLHVIMIAMYKESRAVVEPTIQSVLDNDYDTKQVVLVIAYEERGGQRTHEVVDEMIQLYGDKFYYAMAVEHPKDIEGEIIGKGGNITYAGRQLQTYIEQEHIDPLRVIVTTLDADNQPHKNYLAALTYVYCSAEDPTYNSFQPVAVYTKNIWDAPAPMRVLAANNTVFNMVLTQRPHVLRNFSAHAQSLKALIDTDFWSVRTIVEDGHQFWRTYFRFEGNHQVYSVPVPVYQDAVLSETYKKTLKAQFVQLRRWTYGASDVAYVAEKGFFTKNNIPKHKVFAKFFRLLEGHVNWAVGPLLLTLSAFVPMFINPESYAANELPPVVSAVQRIALIGLLGSVFICLRTLPPRPSRHKRRRTFWMVIQWVYAPFISLFYSSFAAINSQTRLIFKRYLDKFDVTEKAVINDKSGKAEL
ncbi:MAG: glycosyltransferase family 2 protein [Candidatus Saccharimonadales bacterium]